MIRPEDVSLAVPLGRGIELRNPVLAASGCYGYGADYRGLVDNAAIGGFVTKSVTPEARRGNPHPRVAETPCGMLNSIGLENAGIDHFLAHEWPTVRGEPCLAVLSIAAGTVEDYFAMCAKAENAGGVRAIEVNLGCPNVKEGGRTFGADPEAVRGVLRGCRQETDALLIAKLTPNADICAIAQGAEDGGADALATINTLLGMGVDVEQRRPLLAMGMGGLSGPAIRPVALAMTYQVCRQTTLPVIGIGGVATWRDAAEFLLVGARAVQVGTALFSTPGAMEEIAGGLAEWCARHGAGSVVELIGALERGDLIEEGVRV